jgi:hypothetical protein
VGIIVAAIGVVDLATVPFILRRVGGAQSSERALSSSDAPATDAPATDVPADPSYNPYARED